MLRLHLAFCAALIAMSTSPALGEELKLQSQGDSWSAARSDYSSNVTAAPGKADSIISGVAIEQGTVVVRGQFLEPPYIVSRSDKEVRVNGQVIASSENAAAIDPREMMARIERELFDHQSVMIFGSNIVGSTSAEGCMTILGTLAQTSSLYRRIELLLHSDLEGIGDVTTAEWKAALQDISVDEYFVQQYLQYERENGDFVSEVSGDESDGSLMVHDSTQTMYGLSVVGMLLIALSAGTLLEHPPKNSRKWSRIVRSPRTLAAMQRCLVLIAAYSVFDLAATLLAVRTGHVEELNPFGVGLVLAPTALAAFKVTSVFLGAGLLWKLKN